MKLPDEFLFTAEDETFTYTATSHPSNCTWLITWKEDGKDMKMPYSARDVARHVRNGSWKILPETFTNTSQGIASADTCLTDVAAKLKTLINEKPSSHDLSNDEVRALQMTRCMINRLLDDR